MLTLPKCERTIFQEVGNKNIVKQIIEPIKEIKFKIVKTDRSYIVIDDNLNTYCLTCNSNNYSENCNYVILTNRRPTGENITNGEIKLKKWLKHPKLHEYSVNQVLESWEGDFSFIEENIHNGVKGFRTPQIGALHMIMGHLKLPQDIATVVLPTGTGKTETMLGALVANKCEKLLVIVPSDSLRQQIYEKFLTLGLLKPFGLLGDKSLYPNVGILMQKFNSIEDIDTFFDKCNVVVTTMNIMAGCPESFQERISNLCSNVFIDEAHHVKAKTWNEFRNKFDPTKIIQFTATPFRNDRENIGGKTIFNFPLKKAQEQGYYKRIDFLPISNYDSEKADKEIAQKAITKLRNDLENGYDHILMARCNSKSRAESIFELYKDETNLNPVIIYSGIKDKEKIYEKITTKNGDKARIIVCVDMLGEGFDLPELKIAAFHDIRKSLPITLQFAGRFTRTNRDKKLGDASFIANIADLEVQEELDELYAHDADWNNILSNCSHNRINEVEEYNNFITGFPDLGNANIPFQNIRPKLSAVVYKNKTNTWNPKNFIKGIPNYDDLEYKFHDINRNEKVLVFISARKNQIDWGNLKDVYNLDWSLTVVYWETKKNLLFINCTENGGTYEELAKAIIGDNAELINKINVFKVFHNIKRTKLQNVGLRHFLGKNIRFRMHVGSDVGEALSLAEKGRGEKAFVFGAGYEDGDSVNIGCSYKGRIWSKLTGDLIQFKRWCNNVGNKLSNDKIDPNQILRETLVPEMISILPEASPVWIDWAAEQYLYNETKCEFQINDVPYDLSKCELQLGKVIDRKRISFFLITEQSKVEFELELKETPILNDKGEPQDSEKYPDFEIHQKSKERVSVLFGTKKKTPKDFFEYYIPTIWFADGSALTGNEYVELKHVIKPYQREEINAWKWDGVDLSKEAQGVSPKIKDSIQYKVINDLKSEDFDIIYDDDYSGEIADVITIKEFPDLLKINLYHLKFAVEGKVTNQIKNLYEVCGQAQKSVHWKHKSGDEFFRHLLRRITKKKNDTSCSRLEKGSIDELDRLLRLAKKKIPVKFEIFIVQPGFSKEKASNEILTLLGVTENYLVDTAGVSLKVISNE